MLLKTLRLLFLIILSSNLQTKAQPITSSTATDTICRPVPEYKVVYRDAKLYRYTDSLLKLVEQQVKELEGQIKLLNEKDGELKAMYDNQLDILRQEITLYKDQINGYEKLVKRERRKRRLATAGGILTTGLMAYLFITK